MHFEQVLTLVATSPHPPLESKQIQRAQEVLAAAGAQVSAPVWLKDGVAVDILFSLPPSYRRRPVSMAGQEQGGEMDPGLLRGDGEFDAIENRIILAFDGAAIDCIIQPLATRRKKLLIADMDSTIIHQECLDELADAAGLKAEISAITEAAMRGELDFAEALRARVGKLAGLPIAALEATRARLTLMEGARELVAGMRANGAPCYLVSGGFRFFTRYIAEQVGFNEDRSNEFVLEGDHLSGRVVEPILDKDSKLKALQEFAARHQLALSETLAVGDGANDLPMLLASGLGVAYHAKPKVNDAARARVRYSNLTALLYAQGIVS